MTSNTSPLLSTVDEMLLDAGETDEALRAALLSLGAFASLPVPEPRPELATLLSAQTTQLGRHRLRRRHRTQGSTDAEPAGRSPAGQESSAPESDAPGRPEHGAVGRSNNQDSADQGAGNSGAGNPGAGNPGAGNSAADGGASRNAAGATGPGISQDKIAPEAPPRGAAGAPAGVLEKTGKLVTEAPAVVGNLASAILDPSAKEKTGASDAGPGSIWLKKFNR